MVDVQRPTKQHSGSARRVRSTSKPSLDLTCCQKAATSDKITWVEEARWVVDGNYWTGSGVTAGTHFAGLDIRIALTFSLRDGPGKCVLDHVGR